MTREFKFRFWDEEMQSYWGWEEIQNDWESDGYFDTAFRQDHWKCEQFTGFYDRNGKEIYEGDLIKSPSNSYLLKVVWENGAWQTIEYRKDGKHEQLLYCLVNCYGVDLVSNIHENKELLDD